MRKCFRFYVDDSGSPNPNHESKPQNHSLDWFALGGILIDEDHLSDAEARYQTFRDRWPELGGAPLHSYEIRNRSGAFRWLDDSKSTWQRFMDDTTSLMLDLNYYGLACVVDRPGYNVRYKGVYGDRRWLMCKTAFTISVERAAKYARHHNARLRVHVERSNKDVERKLRGYYDELRTNGLPFDKESSAKYTPLSADQLKETLFEFQLKPKATRLMQIADLALWPMCQGGYDPGHRSYQVLKKSGKLLDAVCNTTDDLHGIKYSCFESSGLEKQKPPR